MIVERGDVVVYGPAYLDRVVQTVEPLRAAGAASPIDRSMTGIIVPQAGGDDLVFIDRGGGRLRLVLPPDWTGPRGAITLNDRIGNTGETIPWERCLTCRSWHDDLGGMGAGFARALNGVLISALGSDTEPWSIDVASRLAREGIRHWPVRITGQTADWTLLLSSGPHGDKLPIGFRGCHAALTARDLPDPSQLLVDTSRVAAVVAAGLSNDLTHTILKCWSAVAGPSRTRGSSGRPACLRFFAPAMRNVEEPAGSLRLVSLFVDVVSCNRDEWRRIGEQDRRSIFEHAWLVAITHGPEGGEVWYRDRPAHWDLLPFVAFPRTRPPRDTNRAGEAFAASLLTQFLEDLEPGEELDVPRLEPIVRRASAAAALELDIERFGFPNSIEIEQALAAGVVKSL